MLVSVDDDPYCLVGEPPYDFVPVVNATGVSVTPTQTRATFQTGPIEINATLYNPALVRVLRIGGV